MAGMSNLAAAISMPGVTLSQFEIITRPSSLWAWIIISTESAIISLDGREYRIPSCPIANPSHTAMVLNSKGVPPADSTPSFTASPIVLK